MATWKETIREWFEQGHSRAKIARKAGLTMEFVDECLRDEVDPGGASLEETE